MSWRRMLRKGGVGRSRWMVEEMKIELEEFVGEEEAEIEEMGG